MGKAIFAFVLDTKLMSIKLYWFLDLFEDWRYQLVTGIFDLATIITATTK